MNTAYKLNYRVINLEDLRAFEQGRSKKLKTKSIDYEKLMEKGKSLVIPFSEPNQVNNDSVVEEPLANQDYHESSNEVSINRENNVNTQWNSPSFSSVPSPSVVREESHESKINETPSIKGLESIEKREERFCRMYKKAQDELTNEQKVNSYVFKVLQVGYDRLEKINKIIAELKEMSNSAKEKINVYNVRNTNSIQLKEEIWQLANGIHLKDVGETKFPDINEVVLDVNQKMAQITELKQQIEQAKETLENLIVTNDQYKEKEKKIARDCDIKIEECMKEKQNFFDVMDRSLTDADKIDKLHAQDQKLREERLEKINALTDMIPMLSEEKENSKEVQEITSFADPVQDGRVLNIFDEYRKGVLEQETASFGKRAA